MSSYNDITGAGGSDYTPVAGDVGHKLRARVTDADIAVETNEIGPISAPAATDTKPDEKYVFRICDRMGAPISNPGRVMSAPSWSYRRGQPASFSFSCIAEDVNVAGIHSDGRPYLDAGTRIIKCYRSEYNAGTLQWNYVLRYLGIVWQIQDQANGDAATSGVVCYDPLIMLTKRFTSKFVNFADQDAIQVAVSLLNTTNGISPTGLLVGEVDAAAHRTVSYQLAEVGGSIAALAAAFNGFDYRFVPEDRKDGVYGHVDFLAAMGATNGNCIWGWGIAPHNCQQMSRKLDMSQVANYLTTVGGTNSAGDSITSIAESALSEGIYGRYEAIDTYADVTDAQFLAALTADELNFRLSKQEIVQFQPMPATGPYLFDDFVLGDLVRVQAGPKLRGGFFGWVRVNGCDVSLSTEGVESITGVYCQNDSSS